MAELFVGAITGAIVSAVLTELILLAKSARRCKENCQNLLTTLESVKKLLDSVDQSSDPGNVTCQAWLVDLHTLLVKAKGIVEDCAVKKSRFNFTYVHRRYLSSWVQDIDRHIQGKLASEGTLVVLNIVQRIEQKVTPVVDQPSPFEMQNVPSITVAFENDPFKKLKNLILSMASDVTPQTIGLKGRGGAGKTLLAKMVNNDEDIQHKYGAGSILWITIGQDVSISSVYNRMGKFLNNGGRFERDFRGGNLEEQRTYFMEAFKKKRALVILDDVWGNCEKNHAMVYWLDICKGGGSTTLITTRNDSVLDHARAMERIEVKSLSEKESWKLFSAHAFQTNIPHSQEVDNIAREVCNECKGLPLALEVIGGALWGKKDERDWKYALSRLKGSESLVNSDTLEDVLFCRLQFSYDVLDEDAKKCFLYFAAFPEDYDVPTWKLYSIWEAEGFFGSYGNEDMLIIGRMYLTTLADRSLIDLDEDGRHAKVHDVLRDLAIRIIRKAKIGEWAFECQFEPGKELKTLPKIKATTKRVSFVQTSVSILGPQTYTLKELPESIKELKCLTHLDLSYCFFLKELPDSIKELKSLMYLDLSRCESLKELPKSIKELKCLTHLDLSRCESLKELPESIKELKSLTYLDLSYCSSLKELPESIKELKPLTYLDLSQCESLKELPESIKELKCLMHLNLSYCFSLKELPESIKELKSLTYLDLSWCDSLKELPKSIKELKSLTHLDLYMCESLKELPESIKELKSLTYLDLSRCKSLKELPESIKELKCLMHLDLSYCSSLKELPESIKELKSLTHLDLYMCESLKELPESIKKLKSLKL